jgi:Organic solute transporter Ostalpha
MGTSRGNADTPLARAAGRFEWGNAWPYCTLINNFSQGWALYVLMLFYVAMHAELAPLNPLRKFVTIKLVVFFSFWQGLGITLLAASGWLRPAGSLRTYSDRGDFTGGLQDFVICIEMFVAAVGFAWAFPPRDYMTGEPPGIWQSCYTVFDFTDVMDDVGGAHTRAVPAAVATAAPLRDAPVCTHLIVSVPSSAPAWTCTASCAAIRTRLSMAVASVQIACTRSIESLRRSPSRKSSRRCATRRCSSRRHRRCSWCR